MCHEKVIIFLRKLNYSIFFNYEGYHLSKRVYLTFRLRLKITKINSAHGVPIHQGFVMMSGGAATWFYFMKNATLASPCPWMTVTFAVTELLWGIHRALGDYYKYIKKIKLASNDLLNSLLISLGFACQSSQWWVSFHK